MDADFAQAKDCIHSAQALRSATLNDGRGRLGFVMMQSRLTQPARRINGAFILSHAAGENLAESLCRLRLWPFKQDTIGRGKIVAKRRERLRQLAHRPPDRVRGRRRVGFRAEVPVRGHGFQPIQKTALLRVKIFPLR